MDCKFVYSNIPNVNQAIVDLAGNDTGYGINLTFISESDKFKDYCLNDQVAKTNDLTAIKRPTLRRLLREFYSNNTLDPSRSTKLADGVGMLGFNSPIVANEARNLFADMVSSVNFAWITRNDPKANNINHLIGQFKYDIAKGLRNRFNNYTLTEEERAEYNKALEADTIGQTANKKNIYENLWIANYLIANRNNLDITNAERNANFADLYLNSNKVEFYNFAKRHSKISNIFKDNSIDESAINVIEDDVTYDDDINDVGNDTGELSGTGQWNFGDNIKNYESLVSNVVRQYFDSLSKFSDASYEQVDGKYFYNVDRSNTLGSATCMSYQQCSTELFNLMNTTDASTSIETFMERVKELAIKKREFSSFIKLYHDMHDDGSNINDFGRKIFTDINKFTVNNAELTIGTDGNVTVRQNNIYNNAVRTLYYDMYNDLKSTVTNSNVYLYEEKITAIKSTRDIVNNIFNGVLRDPELSRDPAIRQGAVNSAKVHILKVTEQLKNIFKTYLPSLDVNAISTFIEVESDNDTEKIANIDRLLSYAQSLAEASVKSYNDFKLKSTRNAELRKEYYKRNAEYRELLLSGDIDIINKAEKPILEGISYTTEYIDKNMNTLLGELSVMFAPYAEVNVKLNSMTVDNNLNSDVLYNNYLFNLVKTFSDNNAILAYMQDKLSNNEFEYSNILIDDFDNGIIGLFKKLPNGNYVPTEYANSILDVFRVSGIRNLQNGTNAKYTTMSDSDYFYLAFRTYLDGVNNYKKYNNGKGVTHDIRLSPFLIRVPSDAPKNFFLTMPSYSISELYGDNGAARSNFINNKFDNIVRPIELNDIDTILPLGVNRGVVARNANDFANKIISLIENPDAVVTDKISSFINNYTDRGNTLFANYKVGDKARYIIKLTKNGQVNLAVFEGTIENADIRGENTQITLKNLEYKGIFNNTARGELKITDEFANAVRGHYQTEFSNTIMERAEINKNNPIFHQLRNIIYGEISFATRLKHKMFGQNGTTLLLKESQLYNDLIVKDKRYVDDNGKLVGNAFKFSRLAIIRDANYNNVYDIADDLNGVIDLSSTGGLTEAEVDYTVTGDDISINLTEAQIDAIDAAIVKWINAFNVNEVQAVFDEFRVIDDSIDRIAVFDFMLNDYLFNVNSDDLLEGNSKFYKDAQTFVKRGKENQAGGTSYSTGRLTFDKNGNNPYIPTAENIENGIITNNGRSITFKRKDQDVELSLRTGFVGVTIKNVIRPIENVDEIHKALLSAGIEPAFAKQIASAFGYVEGDEKVITTKTDDAQSYTTIYEAIRRIKQLGEYPKYEKVINQLLDESVPIEDIDYDKLNAFIQVAKNYYFDHNFDTTFGIHAPRQIKNAEFILVPKLLKGTQLGDVLQWMLDNDIDQLNTQEASKAANANVITLWNDDSELRDLTEVELANDLATPGVRQNFNYLYLYRQQEVGQHMQDSANKAGVQIMKKILDNLSNDLNEDKNIFVECFVANIRESFLNLCDKFEIRFDKDYNIVAKNETAPNFAKLNAMALQEVSRLGLDENVMDYFTARVQNSDNPLDTIDTIMPEFMNIVGNKLESIAQSIFNNNITRQKLNGGHATQITNVGLRKSNKLKVVSESDIQNKNDAEIYGWDKPLRYHPEGKPYIEVKVPKWTADLMGVTAEMIESNDIGTMIGYRIPTEGKQSIAVLKVVGFLPDAYGSTIAVPDGWVTQTGADFDVDSVYTITYHTYKDKDGNINKVRYIDGNDEDSQWQRYGRYVNKNVDKLIKQENTIILNEEERAVLNDKLNSLYEKETKVYYDILQDKLAATNEEENTLYNTIKAKAPNMAKYIDAILSQKNKPYYIRVGEVINLLNKQKPNSLLSRFKELYIERENLLNDFRSDVKEINIDGKSAFKSAYADKFKEGIIARAKIAGLMTFDEFIQQTVPQQNSREARTNRLIDAGIKILSDPTNLEETLLRSNFDILTDAKRRIDALEGLSKINRNVYNFRDQLFFRRNAMGGATLKAFSVTRDTLNSINNVARTKLAVPIIVNYSNNINMETAIKNFTQDGKGRIVHEGLGNAAGISNRNVEGYLINPYSSQTTAHILDAVKEGAIPNENPYTFGPFKTLLDVGMDHYSAQLWLRQPAITEIGNAYYKTLSVFNRSNANPIAIAIREVAKKYEASIGQPLVKDGIADYTPLDDIYEAISSKDDLVPDINANGIELDIPTIEKSYARKQYTINELKEDIKSILMFKALKDLSNTIEQHGRVLTADKFGAKQSFFATRKVFYDMFDLYTNGKAAQLESNGAPLLESIFPGSSMLAYSFADENNQEVRSIDDIEEAIKSFLAYNNGKTSSYAPLNAFLTMATAPSYLMNSKRFATENPIFVKAIKTIEYYLNRPINEQTYNQFKKYVLNYMIQMYAPSIYMDIVVDKNGNINYNDVTTEDLNRIYGYGRNEEIEFTPTNINKLSDAEYAEFHKLSPTQKVHLVKSHLINSKDNIFKYLKTNLYNTRVKGVSSQTITFDDQNQNIDYIHKLFEESMNNTNRAIKDTMIDLIKYAFIVEGYNYGNGKVSKAIKNNALYETFAKGGLDIIDNIKGIVKNVDQYALEDENIYEDFIRSHTNIKQLPSHNIKYNKNTPERTFFEPKLKTYYFDMSNAKDLRAAMSMGIGRELADGGIDLNKYILFVDRKRESILYRINANVNNGNILSVYLYPLNKLEANEYGESVNEANNKFPNAALYENHFNILRNQDFINDNVAAADAKNMLTNDTRTATIEQQQRLGVPVDQNFIQNEYNKIGESFGIKRFVNAISQSFQNPRRRSMLLWQINDTLKNAFVNQFTDSVQVINGDTYVISRVTKDLTKKGVIYDGEQEAVFNKLKANNITRSEDIYYIRKLREEAPTEADSRNSSVSFESDLTEISEVGKLNKEIYNDLATRSRRRQDEMAGRTMRSLRVIGVDPNSASSIEANKDISIKRTSEYYVDKANEIKTKLEGFIRDATGQLVAVDDDYTIKLIMTIPEIRTRFLELVLEASTFGNSFPTINSISLDNLDAETSANIRNIVNSINDINNSYRLKNAVKKYIDRYISQFSTNPDIKEGKLLMSEFIMTDISSVAKLFSDSNEINDAAAQVIMKLVNQEVKYGEFLANEAVRDYQSDINGIIKEAAEHGQPVNWDNVVDPKTGAFIAPYTEKFIEDRNRLTRDYNNAKRVYGNFHPETIKARYRRNVWIANNTHQEYIADYYKAKLNNESMMLTDRMINNYVDYLKTQDELRVLYNVSDKTVDQLNRINELRNHIADMLSDEIEPGIKKSIEERTNASVLKAYLINNGNIEGKYFKQEPTERFKNRLEKHLKTINDIMYPNKSNIPVPLEQRLNNPAYVEAVRWLKDNTRFSYSDDFRVRSTEVFSALRGDNTARKMAQRGIIESNPNTSYYDHLSIIDGTKFTDEEAKQIRDEQADKYKLSAESKLIRNKVEVGEVYNEAFYNGLSSGDKSTDTARNGIVDDINKILIHAIDPYTNKVKLSYLTKDQLKELHKLYIGLAKYDRYQSEDKSAVKKFIEDNVDFVSDDVTITQDRIDAKARSVEENDPDYMRAFDSVAYGFKLSKSGAVRSDKSTSNRYIYQYPKPKDKVKDKFIDKTKTNATKFLEDNILFNTTPYYSEAAAKAKAEGRYDEWFENNHIYNPYTAQMEPIGIWTKMGIKPTSTYKGIYNPTYANTNKVAKTSTENYNYVKNAANYKYNREASEYVNRDNATEYEKRIREYMINKMKDYAVNESGRSYVARELFPFKRVDGTSTMDIAKKTASLFGVTFSVDPNRGMSDNISYAYDRDIPNRFLERIVTGAEKQRKSIPQRIEGESDSDYMARIKDVQSYNDEVTKYNKELHAKVRDKNYKDVFADYVYQAYDVMYKEKAKNDFYLLLEYYKHFKYAHQTNLTGDLRNDRRMSTIDSPAYKKEKARKTIELLELWGKRLFFDQYKSYSKFDKIASLAQNLTSAKYMMMNLTGGVSNVLTGSTGIATEYFANQHFDHSDWERAKARYLSNIHTYILGMGSEQASSLEDGLFKLMNIINYDNIRGLINSPEGIEWFDKAKDFAYSPQSAGEHYMQNSTMLAMLISNRIVKEGNRYIIADFNKYRYIAERSALETLVNENPVLKMFFDKFINNIKNDESALYEYQTYHRDIAEEFIKQLSPELKRTIGEKFIKLRKDNLDNLKAEFNKAPQLIDQFELKNSYAALKEDSLISLYDVAGFSEKVKAVNKKIHGVYDKLGAASIESSWVIGSLIMQYHKHIYNGLLKHFRRRGYYNETRESIEKGMYSSLGHYASSEFRGLKDRVKKQVEDKNVDGVDAIMLYMRGYGKAVLDTFYNFKFNYKLMNETDRANLRRVAAELTTVGYAIAMGLLASCILYGDDDNLFANWMLYSADRWASETGMYSFGLMAEAKKMSTNPIAFMSTINDMMNVAGFVTEALMMGDDFNPYYKSGQYAGENKFIIFVLRQVPIYRSIDRLMNLDRNNKYYKLGDNALSIIPTKSIVEFLMD